MLNVFSEASKYCNIYCSIIVFRNNEYGEAGEIKTKKRKEEEKKLLD